MGLEHEYVVRDPDGAVVDFRPVVHRLGLGRRDLVAADPSAYRLPTGSIVTADKSDAELATPPTDVAAGFAARLDGWARWERERLAGRIEPWRLHGVSTHINVTLPDDMGADRVADLFATRFAAGLMLLMDLISSPGLLVRPRPRRLELGGEYVVGRALRASIAYAAGATLACIAAARSGAEGDLPPALDVRLERNVLRYGWYVARTAFGTGDLYAGGRGSRLVTESGESVRAGDALARSWTVARDHIAGLVPATDLFDADRAVGGTDPLPMERRAADVDQRLAPAMAPRSSFGDAIAARARPGFDLAPVMLDWELCVFLVMTDDGRRSIFAAVPGRWLSRFLSVLDAGALDPTLRSYLGRRTRRRLVRASQVASPGLFDALGLRLGLLAPERDVSGRLMVTPGAVA